jgi:hypothetical protein
MSSYVIKLIATAVGARTPHDGRYVKAYEPGVLFEDGTWGGGCLETTDKIDEAQKFPNAAAAWERWRVQKGVRPYDGKPNRPLTAWTAEFETVE